MCTFRFIRHIIYNLVDNSESLFCKDSNFWDWATVRPWCQTFAITQPTAQLIKIRHIIYHTEKNIRYQLELDCVLSLLIWPHYTSTICLHCSFTQHLHSHQSLWRFVIGLFHQRKLKSLCTVFNKKLSYCWETERRESIPRIAEMDVEMTT